MPVNFLEAAGTNGFIATPFNLMSTEMGAGSGLANNVGVLSTAGGSSGVFSQTNFANAIWCEVYFVPGGAITPASPNYIAGWFIFSSDGGTTFEASLTTQPDLSRTPDFIIPLIPAASVYTGTTTLAKATGLVRCPFSSCKVYVVNHAGATLPSSGNLIKAAPVAVQY